MKSLIALVCFIMPALLMGQAEFANPSQTTHTKQDASAGSPSSVDTLRVFTYNIRHGRGMDDEVDLRRIADVIKEKNPHVVTLQEVDVNVERSGHIDIMKVLAGYLGMEPVFYKNIPFDGGEYGNGTLSALPILSQRNQLLIQPDESEQRGLLTTELDFYGVTITLMNTHLDHMSEENRMFSIGQITETKRAYRGSPVIVTGDFNFRPDSREYERITEFFTDVWDEHGEDEGYTFPSTGPDQRIDYFFYTNNLVVEGSPKIRSIHMETIDTEASDHLPIYTEFEIIR